MKNNDWKNLILSVGKLHIRKLSPIEVAQTIVLAEQSGFSLKEIASRCLLKDASILSKFKNLLKIREDFWHLIDWGEEGALISFTIAQMVGRFDKDTQQKILDAKIKYKLNKPEISTLNQRIDLSGLTIEECIAEAARRKKKIIISVFIGSILEETHIKLKKLSQYEKDSFLQDYIVSNFKEAKIVAKIGVKEFTLLIYDEQVFHKISSKASKVENEINEFLQKKIL